MKLKQYFTYIIVVLMFGGMLSACSLLPEEEERVLPVIAQKDVTEKYSLAMVEKRDVNLTETLSCTYSQLAEESLYFELFGRAVEFVYVEKGDEVKAGDLLVSLEVGDVEERLAQVRDELEKHELLIRQAEEMKEFYTQKKERSSNLFEQEECILKIEEYDEKITEYLAYVEYAQNEKLICEGTIEASRLYAGIDGMVSYIRADLIGSYPNADSRIITIKDTSECAFQTQDEAAMKYLEVGDSVELKVSGGKQYSAKVSRFDTEEGKTYFSLDEPDYTLSFGTRATAELLLDSAEQVPAVAKSAVYSTDDFYYVYCLSESGVRELVKIEVGLIGDRYVEIKSGLELQESVISR